MLDERLDALVGSSAKKLASLDLRTGRDLLRHLPRRYEQRGALTPIAELQVGEHVTVLARVRRVSTRPMRRRKGTISEIVVGDGRDTLTLVFFDSHRGRGAWRSRALAEGSLGLFAGRVSEYRSPQGGRPTRQLAHPAMQLFGEGEGPFPADGDAVDGDAVDGDSLADGWAAELLPVYPAGKEVTSWAIRRSVGVLLDGLTDVPDPVPADLLQRHGLPDLLTALGAVHRPRDLGEVALGQRRLRYEEALLLQTELLRRRRAIGALPARSRSPVDDGVLARFDMGLPFALTAAQRRVGEEIARDLQRAHPMHRLLQGDVGSGKTLVALRAMLAVVDAGAQAVLLAPTEVLAQQHARTLQAMLGPLAQRGMLGGSDTGTRVALLTGSMSTPARRGVLLEVASGEAELVVGTHALLQESVRYAELGLVVVDEQHRFGVEQRAALTARGAVDARPHVLVMTATPIPRTVAMTVFGDLDTSVLDELPPNRAEVTTHVVVDAEQPGLLPRAWQRVREEVEAGRRVFVVCPRIGLDEDGDEGEGAGAAVLEVAARLDAGVLPEVMIGVLHGRMQPEEKERAMREFSSGQTPVLVSTTVVEVGVDVPEASMMVVLDADRFGVSALHQLRGRIGRSHIPGLCLLVSDAPRGSPARTRLDAVAATRDGFALAEVDLEQRREGDVLGVAQSGRRSSLSLLSVRRDGELIATARADANALLQADPLLERHRPLADELRRLDQERAEYLEKA